ncbi:glycosyl hydrolase family 1-domain-containing protein [Jimgerdemannia flammicorona]|uniref:Glycosyl hydrolase family 1-domain-containing protein n=1 Tax=Jimgerdemannia flammicorona TaxID=994334 RepID=A0A433D9G6_9FUNG|nr:glycosyl hydrolase family 1-domain-containing protein [Jimgerdemannia flammicorona]
MYTLDSICNARVTFLTTWGRTGFSPRRTSSSVARPRRVSIWDAYSHIPGKIADNTTGDVADDHYHLYKEDVQILKKLGVNHSFSIAWTRILPNGDGPRQSQGSRLL